MYADVVLYMQKKTKSIRVDADAHGKAVDAGLKISVVASRALLDAANKMKNFPQKYPFALNKEIYQNWWIIKTDSLGNVQSLFKGALLLAKDEYVACKYNQTDGYYIVRVESMLKEVVL